MKTKPLGSMSSIGSQNKILITWKDNKAVTMASNIHGMQHSWNATFMECNIHGMQHSWNATFMECNLSLLLTNGPVKKKTCAHKYTFCSESVQPNNGWSRSS